MLGLDRHAARVTWTVFLIVLVILVAYMARHTIIVFLVALFSRTCCLQRLNP